MATKNGNPIVQENDYDPFSLIRISRTEAVCMDMHFSELQLIGETPHYSDHCILDPAKMPYTISQLKATEIQITACKVNTAFGTFKGPKLTIFVQSNTKICENLTHIGVLNDVT